MNCWVNAQIFGARMNLMKMPLITIILQKVIKKFIVISTVRMGRCRFDA